MEILLKAKVVCGCKKTLAFDFTKAEQEKMIQMECNCKKTMLVVFPKQRVYAVISEEKVEDNSESVYVPYSRSREYNRTWRK